MLGLSSRRTCTNQQLVLVSWVRRLLTGQDRPELKLRSSVLSWPVSRHRTQEIITTCRFVHVPLEDGPNIGPKHVKLRHNSITFVHYVGYWTFTKVIPRNSDMNGAFILIITVDTICSSAQRKISLWFCNNTSFTNCHIKLILSWRNNLHFIEASRSHSDTPHSVWLLWMSVQPDTETSTWQHTTLARCRHLCPRRNSKPQSQQASGRRPKT
jgi:hypothetical protein